jgi:hypothetical protein
MSNSEGANKKEKRNSPYQYDLFYHDQSYNTLYDEVVTKQRRDYKEEQRKLTQLNWDGE